MNFQTILINENRLNLMDQNAREFLADARNKYFFEPGELDLPEQFVDPSIPKLG
jgi:Fe-S cluster biosynthesis and repair protein YggX